MIKFLKPIRYSGASIISFFRISPPIWKIFNWKGDALYKEYCPKLNPIQENVVNELKNNGVVSLDIGDIFPENNPLSDLIDYIDHNGNNDKVEPRKNYLHHYWDEPSSETAIIDFENPFINLILDSKFLDIVNSYMESCSKLIYFDLAKTNPVVNGNPAIASQRWHRDSGMKKVLKAFIYLNDVDESSGPFKYIIKSHASGPRGRLFPQKQFGRHGFYPPDGMVEKHVEKKEIKSFFGKAGTIIFCDTTGLHKGGYATSKSRIMFTSMFVFEGDFIRPKFKITAESQHHKDSLNDVSRFSLTKN